MSAEALGKLADRRAAPPLVERLRDSSDLVRANSLRALGRIGSPHALSRLAAALADPEPDIQVAAIEGLVALRATRALPELRRLARPWPLGRARGEVRRVANWALTVLEPLADYGEPPAPGDETDGEEPG
jgi:HEAT repeat protein